MDDDNARAMRVDTALVRELAELLDSTRLTEIEVQDGDRRVRVVRQVTVAAVAAGLPAAALPTVDAPSAAPVAASVDSLLKHPGLVRSPIVGTAYLTPEPSAPNFVAVGDAVLAGATLLIIEAMKVMNPITAPKAGRVVSILIGNEQPVEYDEPLIVIE
jgi:acetyl-CoA carboxylase biotin carboxyl carrier protein